MHYDPQLTPAEREFESALAQLRPAAPTIDRDQLMFSAGVRSTQRSRRYWQAATGMMTALLALNGVVYPIVAGNQRHTAAQALPASGPVEVTPTPPPTVSPLPGRMASLSSERGLLVPSYVHLRNRVMMEGPDVLSSPRAALATTRQEKPLPTYPRAFNPYRNTGGRS